MKREEIGKLADIVIQNASISAALEKQKPKKPKIDGEFGLCKTCNYVFNSELVSEYCVKHCPNCGQAIDWSEE